MSKLVIKAFVVLQRINVRTPGGENLRVIGVWLTRAKAQEMVDSIPGTYVEKHEATK